MFCDTSFYHVSSHLLLLLGICLDTNAYVYGGITRLAFGVPNNHAHRHGGRAVYVSPRDHRTSGSALFQSSTSYSYIPPRKKKSNLETIQLNHTPDIIIRNDAASFRTNATGFVLWSASHNLAHYIDFMIGTQRWNLNVNVNERTKRVCALELGAGLGLPSIVAARHGFETIVTEHDGDVLPLLQTNLERNLESEESYRIQDLDWTNDGQINDLLGTIDVIVVSDLVYQDTEPCWGDMVNLLRRFRGRLPVRTSSSNDNDNVNSDEHKHKHKQLRFDGRETNDPLILMGYTQRRQNMSLELERRFFRLLDGVGMEAISIPPGLVPNCDNRLLTTLFELRWK